MKRRRFIIATGSAILTGSTISILNRPAVGLDFEISATPSYNPDDVNSVIIDFVNFNLKPRYINNSEDLDVELTVILEGIKSRTINTQIPTSQDINRDKISSKLPLLIDGIDTSQSTVDGEIIISIEHSDIDEQTYRQEFEITDTSLIDSFEEENLDAYKTVFGSKSAWNFVTNPVKDGSVSAQFTVDKNGDNTQIVASDPGNGLNTYPNKGDKISGWLYIPDGARSELNYGVDAMGSENNSLIDGFRCEISSDSTSFIKITDPNSTFARDDSFSLPTNQWIQLEIEWRNDNTHIARIFDNTGDKLTEIEGYSDYNHSDGFGFGGRVTNASSKTTVDGYLDYFKKDSNAAKTASIIDDFEQGDLSAYSNNTDNFSATTSVVKQMNYALNGTSSTGVNIVSYLNDGLSNYPERGDIITGFCRINRSGRMGFRFGVKTNGDTYRCEVASDDGFIKLTSPQGQFARDDNANIPTEEWLSLTIKWMNTGDISAELRDSSSRLISKISGTDHSLDGGGIGFESTNINGNTQNVYYDFWRII